MSLTDINSNPALKVVSQPAGSDPAVFLEDGTVARVGRTQLRVGYSFNGKSTARVVTFTLHAPYLCTDVCPPKVEDRAVFTGRLVVPDAIPDSRRNEIVDQISKTFANPEIIDSLITGFPG